MPVGSRTASATSEELADFLVVVGMVFDPVEALTEVFEQIESLLSIFSKVLDCSYSRMRRLCFHA